MIMMYAQASMTVTATVLAALLTSPTNAFVAPTSYLQRTATTCTDPTLFTRATLDITQEKDTTATLESNDNSTFDWNKAWYPLVQVEILDQEIPHRFELLGESIVVWNDGPVSGKGGLFQSKKSRPKKSQRTAGTWRAFVDECPHRKVPLSEGRVEDDGTLLCSYHAWRFNGEGSCVNIPQIENTASEYTRIMNSPKSSCNSYPTKVVDGLLFVWPSSDPNAVLESELTPLPLPLNNHDEDISKKKDTWYGPWNFRQLPYSADFFFENVVDSAHVMVSHHNIIGDRYKIQPMTFRPSTPLSKDGFVIQQTSEDKALPPSSTTFVAPGLVTIDASFEGAKQTLQLYASPSTPGFCNHIGRMVIQKSEKGQMPSFLRLFTLPMPIWLNHVLASLFLNQDALFLHHQERHLAFTGQYTTVKNGDESTAMAYNYKDAVQASPSDVGVISLRNWIRTFAGGFIPYRNSQNTIPSASNDMVFDVWNAHTKYCKYCQDALQRLKVARTLSYVTAATIAITRPFSNVIATLISSFTIAGIGLLLNKLIGMFYRYEFSHAHND